MKLSVSNIGWKMEEDEYVYSLMKKYGYSGLEIAPTRIFPEAPYDCLVHERAVRFNRFIHAVYLVWPGGKVVWDTGGETATY